MAATVGLLDTGTENEVQQKEIDKNTIFSSSPHPQGTLLNPLHGVVHRTTNSAVVDGPMSAGLGAPLFANACTISLFPALFVYLSDWMKLWKEMLVEDELKWPIRR